MKTTENFRSLPLLLLSLIFAVTAQAQNNSDSLIHAISSQQSVTGSEEKGMELLRDNRFQEANSFFSQAIEKDQSDRNAYFQRGVVNIKMNDSLSACRDWSAVLALGDTATYLLLQQNCHGAMIVGNDTIPAKRVKMMWASDEPAKKRISTETNARTIADQLPSYPGGLDALYEYISKNLRYPESARRDRKEGHVYINFLIGSDGKVLFPYVVRGIGSGCDEEALRIVRNMPPWNPGRQNGKPILVRYNLPVRFALNK